MAVRIQFRRGTAAEWTSANPTLAAGELGYESDTGAFKIGNGTQAWNALSYGAVSESYVDNAIANVIDLAPGTLDTLNELAAALGDDPDFFNTVANNLYSHTEDTSAHGIENTLELITTSEVETLIATHAGLTNVHGIANTAELVVTADLADYATVDSLNDYATVASLADYATTSSLSSYAPLANAILTTPTLNDADIANLTATGDVSLPSTTTIGDITATEISRLDNVSSNIQSQLDGKLSIGDASTTYAPIANATFTGTVSLPEQTSIGNVTYDEIGHLDNVSSNIQTQLDAKLATSSAASIYAPLTDPTFINSVSLPANTAIGSVSSTEIGYLDNVTSNIQTQLDDKAPTANPTFTGTVSGITATMVGLGNVDNTSDLDKPVANAVQTALDLKADLAGPVFTGEVEAADVTITGNLVVQGTTTTVSANDLKLRDNMIYLNQAGSSVITAAVHGSGNTVFTTQDAHGYQAGDFVTIADTTPSSFNISGDGVEILAVTTNTFTITATTSDTYTSGGTSRGKVHFNPDLGWAAGRYADNTYAHAGMFRDATDGVFKFFDGYTPEPDESVFIDTSHNTFALADVAVADLKASNAVIFADNTVQTSAGVPSLTEFTEKTGSYTLDTLAHKDNVVEMNSPSSMTFTIPTNSALAWPVGASMDIMQTGSGQVTISPDSGVTLNYTPGNKLRTQWSSCTIMKRGTDSWIVYGDLTA